MPGNCARHRSRPTAFAIASSRRGRRPGVPPVVSYRQGKPGTRVIMDGVTEFLAGYVTMAGAGLAGDRV